ncbi:type II toxin-antitoxin system HicB family antitoxin [Paenibacillus sp. MMO-58]|uniref:type II toxin-antitoxin system HicB family antitoxin n=1 Tax=Paenibacillus sp. MMO-58 TaxID=3081290 RepID=UPI0030180178
MENQNNITFQVLIEEDKVAGDFTAYVPALRLGAQGETLEEVRKNVTDLISMELESRSRKGQTQLPDDNTAFMESLEIPIPVVF